MNYYFAPLINLTGRFTELRIDDHLSVGLMTEEEESVFRKLSDSIFGFKLHCKYVVRYKHLPHETDDLEQNISIYDLEKALLILKNEKVFLGPEVAVHDNRYQIISTYSLRHVSMFKLGDRKHYLKVGDAGTLRDVTWAMARNRGYDKNPRFTEAINRYESGLKTPFMHRPIEYMIALEALFSDSSQELSYKLALRTSYFIEKKGLQRLLIYRIVKKAYEIRSQMVHGRKLPVEIHIGNGEKYFIVGFMVMVAEIVRKSLLEYLRILDTKNVKESSIIHDLDRKIITAECED